MLNFPPRSRFNTAATKTLTAQSDIFAANAAVYSTLSQVKEFISETPMGRGTETRTVILERMRFNMAAKTETVFVHCCAQPGSISVNDTVSFFRAIGFTGNTFSFCLPSTLLWGVYSETSSIVTIFLSLKHSHVFV